MKTAEFTPMLFSSLKGYNAKQLAGDVISGVIVAIIALPLSIALALASGVGPEKGIYTAIVAGFLISFFGGSRVQIAGPTAAFATIVAGIVARRGMEGLIVAACIAGVILIIMGILKIGSLIRFFPFTITTGFTAGIAVTIVIGQIKDFLGLTFLPGQPAVETLEKLEAIFKSISTVNVYALLVGLVCLAILIVWPKISERIPGSLIAVIAGIVIVKALHLRVNTIGDLYTISNSLPKLEIPQFSMALIRAEFSNGFTIAVLAAVESLLSCVVADGMTNSKHRPNMELIAQGIGNIGSALFGGIPATGAIARTAANIKNGGRTPIAGMVHAVVLVLVLIFLMPYATLIPMPTIAAILFMVAYNMSGWRKFKELCERAPKSDIIVLLGTFILTVVFDLVVAIEAGMVVTCVLFVKRMSEEFTVRGWKYFSDGEEDKDSLEHKYVPEGVLVYEINGPMFFGVSERLSEIAVSKDTKCIVIRMRGVPAVDATAMQSMESLYASCRKRGIGLVFSHVNEQPMAAMKKGTYADRVGFENFCPHIDDALKRAEEIVSASKA